MSMGTSPNAALFERALRVVTAMEAENGRLKAERDLQRGEIALLRQRAERLEQDLQSERHGRAELVEQIIDWLEQGEEIVRAGVSRVTRERPQARPGESPAAPGQIARASVLADIAAYRSGARERMGATEFARTYGGEETPEDAKGLPDQP